MAPHCCLSPRQTFGRVVPFLLAFAALALLLQPRISAWLARHRGSGSRFLLPGGLIAVSAYDGYWGAGAGVMNLALLMITTGQELPRSNALKNMLLGVADVTCCAVFILFWPIDWAAAAAMAAGVLAGSMIGPSLTRHLPAHIVRVTAALAGLGLAIHLWAGSWQPQPARTPAQQPAITRRRRAVRRARRAKQGRNRRHGGELPPAGRESMTNHSRQPHQGQLG